MLRWLARALREADRALRLFAERVAERYPRSTIVLFGSRARGDHLPHSDYDVAVILEAVGDRVGAVEELRRLRPRGLPLDLVVLEVGDLGDPIVEKMLEGCRVLYDGLGLAEKLPCRRG